MSPELAGVLQNTALTGVDVGDALVQGRSVAEPATVLLLLVGTALAGLPADGASQGDDARAPPRRPSVAHGFAATVTVMATR